MAKGKAGEHDKRIGRLLKDCRSRTGLTQTAIAHILNVRQQQIVRYESGETRVPRESLTALASLFGYDPPAFLAQITKLAPEAGGFSETESEPFVHDQASASVEDRAAEDRIFMQDLARLHSGKGYDNLKAHLKALLRLQQRRSRP